MQRRVDDGQARTVSQQTTSGWLPGDKTASHRCLAAEQPRIAHSASEVTPEKKEDAIHNSSFARLPIGLSVGGRGGGSDAEKRTKKERKKTVWNWTLWLHAAPQVSARIEL